MIDNNAPQSTRRRFLASGLTLLSSGLVVGSALISGCGGDKGTMQQIENPIDVAEKAKESMKYYMQNKGAAKRGKR